MDVVFTHCAGLDVQQKTVMACRVTPDPTGQQADGIMELQQFGTMTRDLLALSDWLAALSGDTCPGDSPGVTGEASRVATSDTAAASMTFVRAVTLLDTMSGVNQRGGEPLVAE
jgi:hypothetical protein